MQTYKNIEIILVNDGSQDGSGELCDELAKKDNRIIVIHQDNEGQASARNVGISIASGKYIGFVDSDDYIKEDMYEIMLSAAIKEDAHIVQIGHYVVNEYGIVLNTQQRNKRIYTNFRDTLDANIIQGAIVSSVCDKLFHYTIWDNIRMEEGYYYEDGMVLLHLLRNTDKVVTVQEVGYYYVLSSNSTQRGPYNIKHVKSCIYEGNYFYNFFKKYDIDFIQYGVERSCFRAMRGFRFLYCNSEQINDLEKIKYHKQLLEMFNKYYLELKESNYYKSISVSKKIALTIFSINPKVYLKLFSFIKSIR
jgi:glycosyltransferase involved in cell wall biosynthesis